MESDFNFLKNMLIKLLLYISIEELIESLYDSNGFSSFTDSQALCIENSIVKNCSTTTLFHSPFLIMAPGTHILKSFHRPMSISLIKAK